MTPTLMAMASAAMTRDDGVEAERSTADGAERAESEREDVVSSLGVLCVLGGNSSSGF